MDDNEIIRVKHNVTNGVFETTRLALRTVWADLGWTEVDPTTPLTDQMYTSGEEPPLPVPTPGEQFPDQP
jgi:hypothetical protein